MIVSIITISLLFGWQLAHDLHHQPVLLDILYVVGSLVQGALPMSFFPEISEALEAVGVLVHADHHRRSGLVVILCTDAAAGEVFFVVLHHLLYGLFQSRNVLALRVCALGGGLHCFHFLNV
jgi:hypothetical protein